MVGTMYENFLTKTKNFLKIWKILWSPAPKTVGDTLHVEKKVAIAIFWLASSVEYQTVANLFDVVTTFKK